VTIGFSPSPAPPSPVLPPQPVPHSCIAPTHLPHTKQPATWTCTRAERISGHDRAALTPPSRQGHYTSSPRTASPSRLRPSRQELGSIRPRSTTSTWRVCCNTISRSASRRPCSETVQAHRLGISTRSNSITNWAKTISADILQFPSVRPPSPPPPRTVGRPLYPFKLTGETNPQARRIVAPCLCLTTLCPAIYDPNSKNGLGQGDEIRKAALESNGSPMSSPHSSLARTTSAP